MGSFCSKTLNVQSSDNLGIDDSAAINNNAPIEFVRFPPLVSLEPLPQGIEMYSFSSSDMTSFSNSIYAVENSNELPPTVIISVTPPSEDDLLVNHFNNAQIDEDTITRVMSLD
eukprot:PhF_6_TR44547/c0_g1_i1/m.68605